MELGDGWQPNRCVLEKIRIRVNSCPFLNSLLIMIILDSSSCLSYSIVYNITNEKCFVAYNLIFPGTRESRLIQMFVYVMLRRTNVKADSKPVWRAWYEFSRERLPATNSIYHRSQIPWVCDNTVEFWLPNNVSCKIRFWHQGHVLGKKSSECKGQ